MKSSTRKTLKAIAALLSVVVISVIFIDFKIPTALTVPEGEKIDISIPIFGGLVDIESSECSFERTGNRITLATSKTGEYNIGVSFLGVPLKKTTLNVIKGDKVIPGGNVVGIKIHFDGVLVVGIAEFYDGGAIVSPAREGGIYKGDIITHVNGEAVTTSSALEKQIRECGSSEIKLTIKRDGKKLDKKITAFYSKDTKDYKIGTWVKDSTAGIGTLTFVKGNKFAALGHGISDADTGTRILIDEGEITGCIVTSITKGERGIPGELKGVFKSNIDGEIYKNSDEGIYGSIEKDNMSATAVETVPAALVREGAAKILTNAVDGTIKSYDAEIVKVMPHTQNKTKCMVIRITDQSLIEKTGGIVQGMSGSPVIQNGKLVGAVTHVFVNDPTRGYGIFIENMLAEAEKIK